MRRIRRRSLAAALAVAALFGPAAATRLATYPDCEDTLRTPCVTYDEDQWRLVKSYDPYRFERVTFVRQRGINITVRRTAKLPSWMCRTEDSRNCVWLAMVQGNGQGRSFVDINGRTFYLDRR